MNRQAPSNDPALTGRALLWPGLLACAAAAVWIDLTRIQANHDADSLVPMFVSLYGWTPFYWSQNRLGMLVPLLATPFSHPFTNLLVQEGLSIFGWFAGLALLSRWVLKDARWSFAAVGLITSFVLLASGSIRHIFMMSVNYGVSVALGVGALLLLEGRLTGPRVTAAAVLSTLAHWVNIGIVLILLPTVVAFAWLVDRSRARLVAEVGILTLGALAGVSMMALSDAPGTNLGVDPTALWPSAWLGVGKDLWEKLSPHYWELGAMLAGCVGLLVALARGSRFEAGRAIRIAGALIISAVGSALVIGSFTWVRMSEYSFRYWALSAVWIVAGFLVLATSGISGRWLHIKPLQVACWSFLLLAASVAYGRPSLTTARDAVDEFGTHTGDLVSSGATHLAGNYWEVWPAVFHANVTLYERGAGRVLWPLSDKSRAVRPLWVRPTDEMKVALVAGDPEGPRYLRELNLWPIQSVQRLGTIELVQITDARH